MRARGCSPGPGDELPDDIGPEIRVGVLQVLVVGDPWRVFHTSCSEKIDAIRTDHRSSIDPLEQEMVLVLNFANEWGFKNSNSPFTTCKILHLLDTTLTLFPPDPPNPQGAGNNDDVGMGGCRGESSDVLLIVAHAMHGRRLAQRWGRPPGPCGWVDG